MEYPRIMNKVIFLLAVFVLPFVFYSKNARASDFCNGFEAGYITGYKQSSGSSFDPFTPFCPFRPFKRFNDPESDYEHGYIIGYEKGLQKGKTHQGQVLPSLSDE